ncbi:hypothetical protein F5Y10DRAFT_289677 [Nemania abortiva]|nr:hypothetical protein F5Y10DRAFT_289677 [Nemania abortiva]
MATDLVGKGLITGDEQLSKKVQQLIFTIFGIISSLYVPTDIWEGDLLTIDVPISSPNPRRVSDTWAVTRQPIDDANGTLVTMIHNFGTARGPIFYQEESNTPFDEINMLTSSNLHYYTLSKLGGIKLKWVDSICMHLELNRRDKTLMLYRYPSICALLSQNRRHGIFLDRLFKDYIEEINKKTTKRSPAADFFREVLLTYRLLFGQDKRSWKLCKTEGDITPKACDDNDPLLYHLCCQDWENEAIYDEIQAPDVRSVYSARQDFSFFGERLIALQEYTRMLEPDTWRTLYYDRRNLSRFVTIWAAIFFGLATLVFAILGLGLAAAQVVGGFKAA